MDWKTDIVRQLKGRKDHWNSYDEIITQYNHLLEQYIILQNQRSKLEKDVGQLRLTNAGLEKASEASQELANVNNKLSVATEEVVMHLREKGELAGEVLRLNRALVEASDKLAKEESKVQQFKDENDQLIAKIEKTEFDLNEYISINHILREEFVAAQTKLDQLQIEYNRLKPLSLELEQQLEMERRFGKQREEELLESKRVQLEMLNAEVERYNRRVEARKESVAGDNGPLSAPIGKRGSDASLNSLNRSSTASDDASNRKPTVNGLTLGGVNILSGFKRLFNPGIATNAPVDHLNRSSTFCMSASVPTGEAHRWECTDLEVYAIQFHPSGSLLATGCSDKMIYLWEISSLGMPYKNSTLYGSHGAINALDFDNEGARLLAGCSGDKAYIWSHGDNRGLKDTHTGHNGIIYTCKFISGTKLVTGSADRLIKIWDLQNRQCIQTLFAGSKCHDLVVTDATGTIISGHFDKKIRIWDAQSDKCRVELQYNAAITSLSYNAGKRQLLACLRDDTLKLIDLRQNSLLHTFTHDHFQISTDTHKAVLSPDGSYACTGSQDGSLLVWNTEDGMCEKVFVKKHTSMVTSVAWHPEGRYVASSEKHRQVILWNS
ncbi:unnamed protein product [Adineta ricciae]|uniref:Autophagy-related protein 16 domain-containing protein n=1 Tax=Adineta ricciae TaxID=249248 RepID=A0A813MJQ9_ADIRI|nr:unnamed protein product [Adineta ricciae]CAF1303020.1 unnamed protein product [Adineta ricciae]